MRNSISHPKNYLEGVRSHNPTKLLCLRHKKIRTREFTLLTGQFLTMRSSIAQGLFRAIIPLQPLPWDDSSIVALVLYGASTPYQN